MARRMTDISLDSTGDVLLAGGDFVVSESTEQHQRLLLISEKGEWKTNPTIGVGLRSALDDDGRNVLRTIAQEFTRDGMRVNSVTAANQDTELSIDVDASYK